MATEPIVLIVDDDAIGRSTFQALFEGQGYRLLMAPDGPTAIQMARNVPPDLILLDVMMPGMDGFEVTRRIRAIESLAEVPILLVTALDDSASRLQGIEAGADDFVSKPFNRVEMRARVRTITRLNRFRRLSEEREKYKQLFERSPCGLLLIDQDTLICEANTVARGLLEKWRGIGNVRLLAQLIPPADEPHFQQLLQTARRDATARPHAEFKTRSTTGAPVWFEIILSLSSATEPITYQVEITDRTRERMLEEELRQAQKCETIGQLAGGIAHDFNNLLTVINGVSSLTMAELPPGDPIREQIEQVYAAGERAASLTRQLLAFSRKDSISLVELDLNTVIRDTEKMLRRLIGEKVSIKTQLASSLGRIRADPGLIEQVLFNLATNARDAMPEGGSFLLTTQDLCPLSTDATESGESKRAVRLIVQDTGCGIPADILSRIFDPFFTTKEVGKGTGLGLATVQRIVQQLGAKITVHSEVGVGTQFILDFPRLGNTSPGTGSLFRGLAETQGTETILLAEDDKAVRQFACAALESAGYTVLSASNGEEALKVAGDFAGHIHLLLSDAVMPRLSGRGLAQRMLQTHPTIKILYTSGYDEDAVLREGIEQGLVAFLQKPYSAIRLLKKVREVLDT